MNMRIALSALALASIAGVASAQQTYTDAQNDIFDNGFAHLDIANVTVSHDASNITFVVTTRGDVSAPNWGKFMIALRTNAGTLDDGNGWNRPIDFNGEQITQWIGTWADGPGFGGELRTMDGSGGNTLTAATYIGGGSGIISGVSSTVQTIVVSRAALGLTGNDTFWFDVMSSGGGGSDSGIDHLSNSGLATNDFNGPSVAGTFLSYTIPTPGAAAMLGLGALVAGRRRR
jgi:uncharacterized protein (TIGR03382 family)